MTWTYNVILLLCVIGISAAYRRDSFNKKHRLAVSSMVTRKESMEATPRKDTCDGNYFCSSPRGYPIRIMKLKLREARRLGKVSASMFDREEGADRQRRFLKDLRDQRRWDKLLLGKEESESHCRMEPGFVRPRAAVTTSGQMRFVLNDVSADLMDGKIFQTVQTGICEAKGFDAPCGGGGSESYCQQEYTTHRLVALKVNKGKSVELAIDDFQFPSCCNCHLRL